MKNQRDIFRSGEGDAYFLRNAEKHDNNEANAGDDLLIRMFQGEGLQPRSVLEIGASDGWRLAALRRLYDCQVHGVEPSQKAVEEGMRKYPGVQLQAGTAESLPFGDGQFDLVTFGFCLYLCDPADLFRIVAEADRVLQDGGWLAIWDFIPSQAYRNQYSHNDTLFSYKMDHAQLFTAHPAYKLRARKIEPLGGGQGPDADCGVSLIRKDALNAFPDNPYAQRGPGV